MDKLIIFLSDQFDCTGIITNLIKSSCVVDLSRPPKLIYRFSSDKVKKLCDTEGNVFYIDGNTYASRYNGSSRDEFLKWVSKISSKRIVPGKSIAEQFVYDNNLSLWWLTKISQKQFNHTFISTYFHQKTALKLILKELKTVHYSSGLPNKIYLVCNDKLEFDYFHSFIINQNNIKNNEHSIRIINPLNNYKVGFSFKLALRGLIGTLIFFIEVFKANKASRRLIENKNILAEHLIASVYPKDWFSQHDGKSIPLDNDRYLGELSNTLKENGLSIAYLLIFVDLDEVKKWKSISKNIEVVVPIPSELFVLKIFFKIIFYRLKWLLLIFRDLSYVSSKIKVTNPKNKSELLLHKMVLMNLSVLVYGNISAHLYRYEILKNTKILNNVKSIILRKEFHSVSRLTKAALRNTKIKIIGVQHGAVNDQYYQYYLSSQETGLTSLSTNLHSDYIKYMPVPNGVFLFGNSSKNFLMRNKGYPTKRLIVTGPTRQDKSVIINNTINQNGINDIKEGLNLCLDRKLLLLCTGSLYINNIVSLTIKAIKRCSSKPYLIIKFHQSLNNKTRLDVRNNLIDDLDCSIVDSKINELLMISDCVMSQPSTVAYESVLYGKPHILIGKDLYLINDVLSAWDPLIKVVDNVLETTEAIDSILNNNNYSIKTKNIRSNFLKENFLVEDGKANERVFSYISSLD